MQLDKKQIFRKLRAFSNRANALVELHQVGANYLTYYETLQLSLEQFIKSNNIEGFDLGIVRDKNGNTQFKQIESLAPALEDFVNNMTRPSD